MVWGDLGWDWEPALAGDCTNLHIQIDRADHFHTVAGEAWVEVRSEACPGCLTTGQCWHHLDPGVDLDRTFEDMLFSIQIVLAKPREPKLSYRFCWPAL